MDCFISRLKEEIKRDVLARELDDLQKAVALAKLYDEGGGRVSVGLKPRSTSSSSSFSKTFSSGSLSPSSSSTANSKSSVAPLLPTPASKPLPPIKRLTPAEIQMRREKGLCYNCDEKFSLTHKCPNRHYMMMIVDADDGDTDPPPPDDVLPALEESIVLHHLSLHAFRGSQGPCTIRFTGQSLGSEVEA